MGNQSEEILQIYNEIVLNMAELIEKPWEYIVLNFEVTEGNSGGAVTDRICFFIFEENGALDSENLSITIELEDLLLDLRRRIEKSEGQGWDVCDLGIDRSGAYEFNYSYDGPKRLNGIFDQESMFRFDNHIDEYNRRKSNA